jgi:hypothetical protein
MSLLAVMRGCLQIAEHEGEEGKAETAPIIRLIGPVGLEYTNVVSYLYPHCQDLWSPVTCVYLGWTRGLLANG